MKFLFIVKQKKNVDTFEGVIAAVLKDGHSVTLGIQQRDNERDQRLQDQFGAQRFEVVTCPEGRGDAWRASAPLVRSTRDWAQYFRPEYRTASKLRQRATDRLLKELGAPENVGADALTLVGAPSARLQALLQQIEHTIPSDPLHEEFLVQHAPDVVLVTPGVHFGSGQTDFIKSARALGIPVWMLLFSWDNLSTKGALHAAPDLMFVWNERQRQEARDLHDFPADRVVIVGAPRFDEFFALNSVVSRERFLQPLRLDPARPTLLYMCSSRFIADRELSFIRKWLRAVRSSGAPIRNSNVIVRPHPDIALVDDATATETVMWSDMPQVTGWAQRPFDDSDAVVLRTTYRTPQAFFECLHHSDAVVALNTSAELEAGIAGRPVFTVLAAEEGADGQSNTLHFNYLLRDHGGFVSYAPDLTAHVEQLTRALASQPGVTEIRDFIMKFLRPCGDRPVAPLLARALTERFDEKVAGGERRSARSLTRKTPAGDVDSPSDELESDTPIGPAAKTLWLDEENSGAKIFATPETRRARRRGVYRLEPTIREWLNAEVRPGDVVYDIGAGVGAYAIFTAMRRGSLTVAFEPGFSSFKALCDNLLLNGCYRSVMPLPVALGDQTGLFELEYLRDAGSHVHSLLSRPWRAKRDAIESHYTQPVCAERLDDVILRHKLPPPNVIRIAVRGHAAGVLGGAARTLRSSHVRAVLISVKDAAHADLIVQAGRGYGLSASLMPGEETKRLTVRLHRTAQPPSTNLSWDGLRRAASRLRRLW